MLPSGLFAKIVSFNTNRTNKNNINQRDIL